MNPKLKETPVKSWSEPRRFFLWLTFVSVATLASVALYAASIGAPHRNIQMLAVLSVLTFVASLFCFFIAWIPPVRRLLAWLLQRRFFVLACLATLIALFYAVENFRGKRAWDRFSREWKAKGERFDMAGIVPPPVLDEGNFFKTKPWEIVEFTITNGQTQYKYPDHAKRHLLEISLQGGGEESAFGNRDKGLRTDLTTWQNYYRGTNNQFAAANGGFTNYFPIAATAQTPAKDVLLALTKDDTTLRQLREAARCPQARFWINYDAGYGALFPHLYKMKGVVRYLTLHAVAAMADGQSEVAFEDVKLALRISDAIKDEPTLISQLYNIAYRHISLTAIWEGLADHRWTDAQLAELDVALARLNFLESYRLGMRGERNFSIALIDDIRRVRDWGQCFGDSEQSVAQSFFENTFGNAPFRLVPGGWFDQNKLWMARTHMELVLPAVDIKRGIVAPSDIERMDTSLMHQSHQGGIVNPFNMFGGMLLPALSRAAQKHAVAQSAVDLARTAIALERCRLAHGSYPDSLDALVPQFIAKLPHDVINGQPLHYRRTDDPPSSGSGAAGGSFILYSVGWNEKDDGGSVVLSKDGKTVDWKEGDWVWRYPAQ